MGGAVSAGADNDELVDNLVEADFIKTSAVERVFRAVDRGHFFTPEGKESAYHDLAWKCGNLHISAPCIYSEVMENLKLAPGMSFLNLGSGTGYLNTLAGLMLGSYGINHGIELHDDVVKYAAERVEEFCSTSPAVDEYEFCQPNFISGNCLFLGSEIRQYDRVYCGASCPENHENYMKNLIKVGGILVVPINDQLLQIYRTSETVWETKSVLPVSFAPLVCITENSKSLKMPDADPLSLQEICRSVVRSVLRRIIDVEHPELKKRPPRVPRKRVKKGCLRRLVIPIVDSHSDSEENEVYSIEHDRRRDLGRAAFLDVQNARAVQNVIELSQIFEDAARNDSRNVNEDTKTKEVEQTQGSGQKETDEEMSLDDSIPESKVPENTESKKLELADDGSSRVETEQKLDEQSSDDSGCAIKQKDKVKEIKREKFDSGIVEDIENGKEDTTDSDREEEDEDDFDDEDDDEDDEDEDDDDEDEDIDMERELKAERPLRIRNLIERSRRYPFLKVVDSDTDTDNCETATEKDMVEDTHEMSSLNNPPQTNVNTYSSFMKEKIKMLPLPMTLKHFVNLNREL